MEYDILHHFVVLMVAAWLRRVKLRGYPTLFNFDGFAV